MSRTMKAYLLIFAAVLLAGAAAAPAQVDKRPMTFEDVLKIKRVGDPQWSPDGREVLYTVREVDLEKDRYVTHIWRIRIGEKEPQPMTNGEQGERSPRWAPDGETLRLPGQPETAKTQIWLMARNGGEARKFTEHLTASSLRMGAGRQIHRLYRLSRRKIQTPVRCQGGG
ncbi:MAG: hypothetical protein Q9P14_15915 [candidate division KSB1 bacterium]|nr:hypothetical protein [candidate division KSB1 bacterium]